MKEMAEESDSGPIQKYNMLIGILLCTLIFGVLYMFSITIFIGIIAIPVLPLQSILKVISVFGFWFVGVYYLAQIIYTYGQLKLVYGYLDIDDTISKEVKKLGFPFNVLEKIFELARKPVYGSANIKYFGIGLGYLGLLGISIIACI